MRNCKKIVLILILAALCVSAFSDKDKFTSKTNVTIGVTPRSKEIDEEPEFGGAYIMFDSTMGNAWCTLAGKVYWRFSSAYTGDEASQKLDIKKANVKVRPLGTDLLEAAIGKLYSYALPGSYFQLSEIYTGASRWGKTGVGVQFNLAGFSGGLAVPLTESYVAFKDSRGLHGGLSYDFASILPGVPLKIGSSVCYDFVAETKPTKTSKGKPEERNWSTTVSILWSPKFEGLLSALSVFASYTDNAEPYVASSTFKKISNYKLIGKADFASMNVKASIGKVQFALEGEAGRATEADYIPLYIGLQTVIPIVEHLAFRPRVFYYAALSTKDDDLSRTAFELYPRLWFTMKSHTVSAGVDFSRIETKPDTFEWEWSIPLYYEYSFGK